ncbi:MAG: vWA domain-containing protein [Acidobacteriota bacterium]
MPHALRFRFHRRAVSTLVVALFVAAPSLADRPVDVVFALDTTGSMGSMIAGAKEQIWGIAGELRRHSGSVRFGLVGYRDTTDDYVTRVHELRAGLLAVERDLRAFQAAGGGDTPEAVNEALFAALHDFEWRSGARKMILLVGDAPPHLDRAAQAPYAHTAKLARERGVVIHTLLCGHDATAKRIWQEIAADAGGRFVQLDLEEATRVPATPFDEQIRSLQRQLNETVVPFGSPSDRAQTREALAAQARDSAHQTAERLEYQRGDDRRVAAGDDLVDRHDRGEDPLANVDEGQLPETLQRRNPDERRQLLEDQAARRRGLWSEVRWLSERRRAFLQGAESQRAETLASIVAGLSEPEEGSESGER